MCAVRPALHKYMLKAQLVEELPWEGGESIRNTASRSAMSDEQGTEAGKLPLKMCLLNQAVCPLLVAAL